MVAHEVLVGGSTSPDPEVGLRSVLALRDLVERLEALQVANARRADWSWRDIASVLGVSRQAVHKKYRNLGSENLG